MEVVTSSNLDSLYKDKVFASLDLMIFPHWGRDWKFTPKQCSQMGRKMYLR
jgi:hypothetical protein